MEEALDLRRMEVHRHDAVCAGSLDSIRADTCTDGYPWLVFLIPLTVAEVGNHGRHRFGTGALAGVDPEEELHESVVGRKDRRLHHVDAAAAHIVQDADECVAVREPQRLIPARRDMEVVTDPGCEAPARAAGKDHDIVRAHADTAFRRGSLGASALGGSVLP